MTSELDGMKVGSGLIDWTEESGFGVIRLNRPEKLNALTHAMMDEIIEFCHQLRIRHDIKAVVFLGNGRSFCAGQDLKESGGDEPALERLAREFRDDMQTAIAELPQPTIAGLNGHALGRGLMLALACDIRFCSDDARLGFPEVKFGIIPGGGGTQRLAKLVGPSRAIHMVLSSESIDAETALQWGLVTKVIPGQDLEKEVLGLASSVAAIPRDAGLFAKLAIGVAANTNISEGVKFEKTLSAVLTSSSEWKSERSNFGKG